MQNYSRWVEIDAARARDNLGVFKAMGTRVMAVVKADCYGHGAALARVFADAGADWFAVASVEEGLALRDLGLTQPILVLGVAEPEYAAALAAAHITAALPSADYARALSRAATDAGVTVDVHVKLDTGMGRIGFAAADPATPAAVAAACRLPGIRATGVFQHFAVADETTPEADAFTRAQYARFMAAIDAVEALGVHLELRHCCNSAAALRFPEMRLDMVRAGISLYGLPAGDAGTGGTQPVLSWYTRVTEVKTLAPGDSVGYGRAFIATKPVRVATVAVGYADGFRRLLAGKFAPVVGGRPCPILGRVCMDQIMLDVTGLSVAPGDVVTLIGDGAPCSAMAEALGTIEYEVVCLIGARCPRVVREE